MSPYTHTHTHTCIYCLCPIPLTASSSSALQSYKKILRANSRVNTFRNTSACFAASFWWKFSATYTKRLSFFWKLKPRLPPVWNLEVYVCMYACMCVCIIHCVSHIPGLCIAWQWRETLISRSQMSYTLTLTLTLTLIFISPTRNHCHIQQSVKLYHKISTQVHKVCVYIYIYIYIYIHTHRYTFMHIRKYACMHTNINFMHAYQTTALASSNESTMTLLMCKYIHTYIHTYSHYGSGQFQRIQNISFLRYCVKHIHACMHECRSNYRSS
jgi:hypothetical protein